MINRAKREANEAKQPEATYARSAADTKTVL